MARILKSLFTIMLLTMFFGVRIFIHKTGDAWTVR